MSTPLSFAIALTRSWTATYTRGLPAGLRAERREEIACDLWEHQRLAESERVSATGTAVEILLRLLLGLPADLLWRLEAGATARSERGTHMNDTPIMRGLLVLAFLVALAPAGFGISVLAGGGDLSSSERLMFGVAWVAMTLLMVAGLAICTSRPRLGIGLVAAGVVGISVGMFWIFFITLPIGGGLVYLAYRRARQAGWPRVDGKGLPNATA